MTSSSKLSTSYYMIITYFNSLSQYWLTHEIICLFITCSWLLMNVVQALAAISVCALLLLMLFAVMLTCTVMMPICMRLIVKSWLFTDCDCDWYIAHNCLLLTQMLFPSDLCWTYHARIIRLMHPIQITRWIRAILISSNGCWWSFSELCSWHIIFLFSSADIVQ